jgi:hypothetical protein
MCLMDVDQACQEAGIARHIVRFSSTITLDDPGPASKTAEKIFQKIKGYSSSYSSNLLPEACPIRILKIQICLHLFVQVLAHGHFPATKEFFNHI